MPTNSLTNSPADIVAYLLAELGAGSLPTANTSWPIYAGGEPDLPDNCITVYDTEGSDHGRNMVTGEVMGHQGIQIRVRANTHNVGWARADLLSSYLADVRQRTVSISGVAYTVACFARIGDVIAIGRDRPQGSRRVFTLNALVDVKQV